MEINKEHIILLGDGFFARGFLHNINYKKFNVTQIYKDEFINPQDIMYALERDQKYEKSFHFRDLFYKKPIKIKQEIVSMKINNNNININDNSYNYDYLVIGLGSQKSLVDWKNEINKIYSNKYINIIGMGPIGLEITNILSNKFHFIKMFDLLDKNNVFNYVNPKNKELIFNSLNKTNIKLNFGQRCNENNGYNLYCIGSRPNNLTSNFKPINKYLQLDNNIYLGGDCANYNSEVNFIKTGQVAYQQGAYVAKRLNGDIPLDKSFEYNHNGISLHLGNKQILIEGHKYLPDNVYPDFFIKLYSLFFI